MAVIAANKEELLLYFFQHFFFSVIKVHSNGFSDFFFSHQVIVNLSFKPWFIYFDTSANTKPVMQ